MYHLRAGIGKGCEDNNNVGGGNPYAWKNTRGFLYIDVLLSLGLFPSPLSSLVADTLNQEKGIFMQGFSSGG